MAKALFAILIFSVVGCCPSSTVQTPVTFVPMGTTLAPHPRPVAYVEVFTARPPQVPFVEAGILVEQGSDTALRWGAAQVGCNAIFMLPPVTEVSSGHNILGKVYVDSRTTYRATCLVYVEARPPA